MAALKNIREMGARLQADREYAEAKLAAAEGEAERERAKDMLAAAEAKLPAAKARVEYCQVLRPPKEAVKQLVINWQTARTELLRDDEDVSRHFQSMHEGYSSLWRDPSRTAKVIRKLAERYNSVVSSDDWKVGEWGDRPKESPKTKLDFCAEEVPIMHFEGLDLSDADFGLMILPEANFRNCIIDRVCFAGCYLHKARITMQRGGDDEAGTDKPSDTRAPEGVGEAGGLFGKTTFMKVHLSAVKQMRDQIARLTATFFKRADPCFKLVDFQGAFLQEAVLQIPKFERSNIVGACLKAAKLQGVDFDGCDMMNADIEDAVFDPLPRLQSRALPRGGCCTLVRMTCKGLICGAESDDEGEEGEDEGAASDAEEEEAEAREEAGKEGKPLLDQEDRLIELSEELTGRKGKDDSTELNNASEFASKAGKLIGKLNPGKDERAKSYLRALAVLMKQAQRRCSGSLSSKQREEAVAAVKRRLQEIEPVVHLKAGASAAKVREALDRCTAPVLPIQLKERTRYAASTVFRRLQQAATLSPESLARDANELDQILSRLNEIRVQPVGATNWDDTFDAFHSLYMMGADSANLKGELSQRILVLIFSDRSLLSDLGLARQLHEINNPTQPPVGLVLALKRASNFMKVNHFSFQRKIEREKANIARIRDWQQRFVGLVGIALIPLLNWLMTPALNFALATVLPGAEDWMAEHGAGGQR
mmetsp:Transcript_89804/g.279428  ORF Transcript_89804/g.279428 Transcript_89804/m.279428 type:complete len:708 (-) Transcript_89804:499-2622(-)